MLSSVVPADSAFHCYVLQQDHRTFYQARLHSMFKYLPFYQWVVTSDLDIMVGVSVQCSKTCT